jgi:2,4-dienoyl-CoA reductase-like NADH-dependent reductase (Old Yellow Enzyme family)/thioredoxin reductase
MAAAPFPRLFSPLPVGRFTFRNRIVSTSHDAHFGEGGLPTERYIRYHVEKARGGAALVQAFGTMSVHPTSPSGPGNVNNWDDAIIPPLRRLAEQVHAAGALVTCQLVHRGRRATSAVTRMPLLAPSDEPNDRTGEVPRAMTREEIAMVIRAYAAAAERAVRAGLDGVEIACFGDMLPDQFLSPRVNRRDDEYGGSFEGRLRFPTEVVTAVREAIGDRLLLVRMSADDFLTGELTREERLEVARRLDALGVVDIFSITAGTVKSLVGRSRHVPSSYAPHGVYLPLVHGFTAALRAPVIYAGRIVHPEEAERVLAEGIADLVGMTRAIIADPEMPRKAAEGRVDDIRLCVGANEGCIGRLYQGLPIECVQNPAIGREAELAAIIPTARRRRVVVVGGGPAGLEAARVAALRGHEVILLERRARLGGQIPIAAMAPGREEIAGITAWLERQVRRHGVEVRLGVTADVETVLRLEPEAVVVATGSVPRPPAARIREGAVVLSAAEVLEGGRLPGRRVVVLADDPHMAGPTTADFLAVRGYAVTVLAPGYAVGEGIDDTLRPVVLARLLTRAVDLVPLHRAVEIHPGHVEAEHVLTGERRHFEADAVVAACGGRADDALSRALRGAVPTVLLVGDALAPRRIHEAILDGTRAGRAL